MWQPKNAANAWTGRSSSTPMRGRIKGYNQDPLPGRRAHFGFVSLEE